MRRSVGGGDGRDIGDIECLPLVLAETEYHIRVTTFGEDDVGRGTIRHHVPIVSIISVVDIVVVHFLANFLTFILSPEVVTRPAEASIKVDLAVAAPTFVIPPRNGVLPDPGGEGLLTALPGQLLHTHTDLGVEVIVIIVVVIPAGQKPIRRNLG